MVTVLAILALPTLVLLLLAWSSPERQKTVVFAFIGGIVAWLAWLSWPIGPHGDYAPWQVVVCGTTMVALVAGLTWWRPAWWWGIPVAVGAATGLTVMWAWWAGSQDETGQWGMGLALLVPGVGLSMLMVALVTTGVTALFRELRVRRVG